MRLTGLFAALATPFGPDGAVDPDTLDRMCDFVLERGVDGVCIGGATGEYPRLELAERLGIVARVSRRVPRDRGVLTAIGASSVPRVLALAEAAARAGSRAVLLPMPLFFRYEQMDLAAYCAQVAGELDLPCLLYDLPEFTSPIEPATAITLLEQEPNIAGIKDSSGRAENLRTFARARAGHDWTLLVGDDRYGLAGREAGWDGAISGVACCCPELLVALHRSFSDGDRQEALRCQALLDELIGQLSVLPVPWGIRVALKARGLDTGPLPLPPAAERLRQMAHLEEWLPRWLETAGVPNLQPVR